jgi:hypothetical protein
MQAWVNLTCPYCGHKQDAIIDMADFRPYTRPQVVNCDCEEGGCDKWFVFEARATFTVTTGTIGGDLQPVEVQPEAPQVDWSKAPGWAKWHAYSKGGSGWWFAVEPRQGIENFLADELEDCAVSIYCADLGGFDWTQTLTPRPQEAR